MYHIFYRTAITPVCDKLAKLVSNCEEKANLYCLDAKGDSCG